MNKVERSIFEILSYEKYFRCPKCNEHMVKYIPRIEHKPYEECKKPEIIHPRKMLKSKQYYCFNCKANFTDIKSLAIVDGIFLGKNTDMKERSKKYVNMVCRILKLSNDVEKYALEILEEYNTKWGYRNTVAASVYISAIMCGERRNQREVADALETRDYSLRTEYQNIKKTLDLKVFVDD